ncbi:hypothetical protein Aspvir_003346 [Aspergillus viridinutans]|uniref:Xylanolytic transcriptional activator regulatory domain-containing protein n=1 Tax=Aspergillus viridinutans TaxID=75553 RepID=A0A9P3C4H9_ASPVI|nr:uncharacterized protein Aspvir_003346 [Aspergillus viridinutans]GIK07680.1 hypothetical protein Aspvir_003346 [Aspergillus viridinutans]
MAVMRSKISLAPVISRSQLGLTPSCQIPEPWTLDRTPVHLLAAIYTSALPFAAHDNYVCVLNTYNAPPVDRLWRMVYELLTEEIHTPHLAVLQAAILYAHKPVDERRSSVADSPFVWCFVGTIVGLTSSLGLHIECRMWGIPAWEKRLRRRLWWAVYAKDKGEWNVSELDSADFTYQSRGASSSSSTIHQSNSPEMEVLFRYLVDLSRIAEDIYVSFYTLRASQFLSEKFNALHDTGRPLLEKLSGWYLSLPESFRLPNWSKSLPTISADSALVAEDYSILDFDDLPEIESFPAVELSDDHGTGEATLNVAERCASIVISFTGQLTASDFTGFWYSWSRIGFATVSNFTMLLLVQAPNADRAVKGKHLVESWLRGLRCQSQSFPMMKLGLTRFDAMHWAGLAQTFLLPQHVVTGDDSK